MNLSKASRDPWVWGQLGLFLMIGAGVPWLADAGVLGGTDRRGSPIPGILLLGLGLGMSVWGVRSIGPNLTPGTEPLAQGHLVDRGAYAFVRHPIYLGIVLLLAGWAWWMGNHWFAALTAIITFLYFDRKAAAEERWLLGRFPGYETYRSRVGKMVPRLG